MASPQHTYASESEAETIRLGEMLGRGLPPASFVGLRGELGSGKTTFCRGLAQGLGVNDPSQVHSPTFTLINVYDGSVPMAHLDLYRLHNSRELEDIGYRDLFDEHTVIVVEWVEKILDVLPETWLEVSFSFTDSEARQIICTAHELPNRR